MKQKLWGGAFDKGPDDRAWAFGQSISSDAVMWQQEIQASIVHARMLGRQKVIEMEDSLKLVQGLGHVHAQIEDMKNSDGKPLSDAEVFQVLTPDAEDIHAAIESLL